MARMDLRLRAWGAVTRRQVSVATRSEADIIAFQRRQISDNAVTGWILGKAVPGAVVGDRSIPGSRAAANAAELGAQGPLGVLGESAGGNLAAVICLLARDRGGPAISHQALIYPATNMTATGKSAAPAMPFLSPAEMTAYRRMYLGPDGDPADPMASPLLAADHGKLPPALVQVAEHDPLRDEGLSYAAALRAAGLRCG